jgi:hypothetical protein
MSPARAFAGEEGFTIDRAQHPGSARRASEQAHDAGHDYTRDQVANAERWAWAGEVLAGRAEFFFDGISFWRQDAYTATRTIAAGEAPRRGWWHMSACDCRLCRARRAGDRRSLPGRLLHSVPRGEDDDPRISGVRLMTAGRRRPVLRP